MGRQTGAEFLHWLRLQIGNTSVPVIMYSGSVGARHITECYSNGANHFLRKPMALEGMLTIVRTLYDCVSSRPPGFEPLLSLPEYFAGPQNCKSLLEI